MSVTLFAKATKETAKLAILDVLKTEREALSVSEILRRTELFWELDDKAPLSGQQFWIRGALNELASEGKVKQIGLRQWVFCW